jgi:hypothetical protein
MNSHRYLGMALGASMSLCAPALALPLSVTIDDRTEALGLTVLGDSTTLNISVPTDETATITGTLMSSAPPPASMTFLYNIIGSIPIETVSDTLSITVAPTTSVPGANTSFAISFISDSEGFGLGNSLFCTGITNCTVASIFETGAFQSVTTGLPDLTVSFASDAAVVPIPGTLPLFATGLGALGLLGWRRKRKAAA